MSLNRTVCMVYPKLTLAVQKRNYQSFKSALITFQDVLAARYSEKCAKATQYSLAGIFASILPVKLFENCLERLKLKNYHVVLKF